ncbi:MAG: DUF5615 family PIN-like protein [Phycisphaerales bacterium]|nr:DUF5615 family PIN-like protein [Phycisphaerales bacterium]MCI0629970.1 DUF5615 family PIN-like protein [Phycisphaerales bacterium]
MDFKVDEDLPLEVAEILRGAGHDARTVVEQKLGGAKDEQLWKIVQSESRCLVTADKGVANAKLHPAGDHAGIILFRLPRENRAGSVRLARSLLLSGKLDTAAGAIVVVGPESMRIHRA